MVLVCCYDQLFLLEIIQADNAQEIAERKEMNCEQCGAANVQSANYCSICGHKATPKLTTTSGNSSETNQNDIQATKKKKVWIAILLSFFITGAGQIYAGATKRGIIQIMIYALLFPGIVVSLKAIVMPYWLWGMYDAFKKVKDFNDPEKPSKHAKYPINRILLGGSLIGIIIIGAMMISNTSINKHDGSASQEMISAIKSLKSNCTYGASDESCSPSSVEYDAAEKRLFDESISQIKAYCQQQPSVWRCVSFASKQTKIKYINDLMNWGGEQARMMPGAVMSDGKVDARAAYNELRQLGLTYENFNAMMQVLILHANNEAILYRAISADNEVRKEETICEEGMGGGGPSCAIKFYLTFYKNMYRYMAYSYEGISFSGSHLNDTNIGASQINFPHFDSMVGLSTRWENICKGLSAVSRLENICKGCSSGFGLSNWGPIFQRGHLVKLQQLASDGDPDAIDFIHALRDEGDTEVTKLDSALQKLIDNGKMMDVDDYAKNRLVAAATIAGVTDDKQTKPITQSVEPIPESAPSPVPVDSVCKVNDEVVSCKDTDASVKLIEKNRKYVVQGGLTWMPVALIRKWEDANTFCTNTAINGQPGWRLPTKGELIALYASGAMNGHGWTLDYTWSSTPYSAGFHYYVFLYNGYSDVVIDTNGYSVTCVR
jgi:TM2 domain-containing membrane protein YozV/ribosomal protein L37E